MAIRVQPHWDVLAVVMLLCVLAGCLAAPAHQPRGDTLSGAGEGAYLGPQSTRAKGQQRVLMLAVRFKDVEPGFSLEQIRQRTVSRLNDYVKAQSYGQAWITPRFIGWVDLPDNLSAYRVSPDNFKVDEGRVRKLIQDAMTGVEKEVDFSKYDHLLIVPGASTLPGKGYGMMCYCANPGMLTGVRGNPEYVTLRARGGQTF